MYVCVFVCVHVCVCMRVCVCAHVLAFINWCDNTLVVRDKHCGRVNIQFPPEKLLKSLNK